MVQEKITASVEVRIAIRSGLDRDVIHQEFRREPDLWTSMKATRFFRTGASVGEASANGGPQIFRSFGNSADFKGLLERKSVVVSYSQRALHGVMGNWRGFDPDEATVFRLICETNGIFAARH